MKHSDERLPVATPRVPDHAVDRLFVDRWSPRAFSDDAIPQEELMILFEAARWAPSSYNNQPWRMLYTRRGGAHWETFLHLLNERNQSWAGRAAALVLFVGSATFEHNGKPSHTHQFDTGAAWVQFALQAALRGYVAHAMQGFDYERARAELKIPTSYTVLAMVAVGRQGDPAVLPAELRANEHPNTRRSLAQTICEGEWRLG